MVSLLEANPLSTADIGLGPSMSVAQSFHSLYRI